MDAYILQCIKKQPQIDLNNPKYRIGFALDTLTCFAQPRDNTSSRICVK